MTQAELIRTITEENDPRKVMELAEEHWKGEVRHAPNEREQRFVKHSGRVDYWVFEVGGVQGNRKILKAIDESPALIPYRWRVTATETTIFALDKSEYKHVN